MMASLNGFPFRDGHADIFADAHRCGYPHFPTYVGYSAILSDNVEVDADIRNRMAIPIPSYGTLKDNLDFGKYLRLKKGL